MAKRVRDGYPWLRWEKGLPKLVVHEKRERAIRWVLRAVTAAGILVTLTVLPIYAAFGIAVFLASVDALLEKTIFYNTSLYVRSLPDFEYDGSKWVANVFISFGEPSPESDKIVGLVFNDREYAKKFFDLLRSWNDGSSEDTQNNIRLTFITDEDTYYVYLYPSIEDKRVNKFLARARRSSRAKNPNKEHLGLVMQLVICQGFQTGKGYALGEFVNNHPNGKHFLLGPFVVGPNGKPEPLAEIEPISKLHYKAKIPSQLNERDFELAHWRRVVQA